MDLFQLMYLYANLCYYYRHRSEHTKILEVRNALNADRAHSSRLDKSLKGSISALKKEGKELSSQNSQLKRHIAWYIAQLDLADNQCRVFTCGHDSLDNLLDGQKATRQKTAGLLATEIFDDWSQDADFITEYHNMRQYLIDHHGAHERTGLGRGERAVRLENIFNVIDARRRIASTNTC